MPKVRIALLGCGGWMGAHAQRLRNHPDAEIVGLCDERPEAAEKLYATRLEGYLVGGHRPGIFTDPGEMYRQAKPDAVLIATPHTLHFQHAVQALDAGLHVFIEKPMVTEAEHAYRLADKAKEAKKIVVVGYNTPCTPEFNHLREIIRTGRLGRLEMVMGYLSQNWKRFTTGLWRQKPELSGGGQAYDSGAHLLNSLVWSVESSIAEVFAFVDNQDTPVDINSSINIKFESGVLANIVISGNCPADGAFMTFIFDGGRVDINGWYGDWIKVWEGNTQTKYPVIPGKPQTPDENFIDAILGRAEPRTSPLNGIIQSELMDAIYESAKTGRVARPHKRVK